MGRLKILLLSSLLLVAGCMTVDKATNYLNNKGALPGICAAAFPVHDSMGIPVYRPANNIDYTAQLDTANVAAQGLLLQLAAARAKAAQVDPRCAGVVDSLANRVQQLTNIIAEGKKNYRPPKPDTIIVPHYLENTALVAALQKSKDSLRAACYRETARANANQAYKNGVLIGAGVLIALLGVGAFLKFKSII